MALTIGPGISVGPGISLLPEGAGGGGGATPNTFTIAEFVYDANSTYYGASTVANFTFGTLTSDYIDGIYKYVDANNNNQSGYTFVRPKDGTYTGFSVTSGLITGDLPSYPRNFIINGTTYRTHCDGYQYFLRTDPENLSANPGETFTITYDPNSQPTTAADTMLVEAYTYYTSYYGANADISGPVQGELFSDYFKSIVYSNSTGNTDIKLKDGSYTGFTVSGGSIDGDSSSSTRYFNINGYNVLCTFSAGAYSVATDAFSLQTASSSTAVSVVYDPAAQSGGGGGGGTFTDGTAYSSSSDYSSMGISVNGNVGNYNVVIRESEWTATAGYNALYALTTGGRFKINTSLDAGGTGDSIVTLSSGWSQINTGIYSASVTFSVAIQTGQPINAVTLEGEAPAAPLVTGTMTVALDGSFYGASPYAGTLSLTPTGLVRSIMSDGSTTMIEMNTGTFGDVVVVSDGGNSIYTINDSNTLEVTIDGVLYSGTLSSMGPYVGFFIMSDVFGLVAKNNQTLNVSFALPAASSAGYNVGDGTTISIATEQRGEGAVVITLISSAPAPITSFTTNVSITLTKPGTTLPLVLYDFYDQPPIDNMNGTTTHSYRIVNDYPNPESWDSMVIN